MVENIILYEMSKNQEMAKSIRSVMQLKLLLLLLDQELLLLLKPLILDLLLSDQLDGQLVRQLNDPFIVRLLVLVRRGPFDDPVKDHRARVNVLHLQKLFANLKLAPDNGVQLQLQHLLDHQLHLCAHQPFLNDGIRSDVEMGFVGVAFRRVQSIPVTLVPFIRAIQRFLQSLGLLHQGVQLLSSHHGVDLRHVS